MDIRPVTIEDGLVIGGGTLVCIAGPCAIEGREITLRTAERVAEAAAEAGVPAVFKASFDKANRTSLRGYRGIGVDEGLEVLSQVRRQTGLPVLTDVHLPEQAAAAAQVAQLLQVPAFLSRQTDLLAAVAATGRPVNVKKGQFLAPGDMRHVVDKLRGSGATDVLLTERGTSFGYHDLVVDMRSLPTLRALGCPVVFDATHAVQRPSAAGDRSGGDRRLVPPLLRAAVAAGVDAVFLEVHEHPDRALSDGPNSLPLDALTPLLLQTRRLAELVAAFPATDAL
jgi:2-dehydro-3-deoxyphosphooctonate aldolase (KDO 8-P synthase)